MKSGRSRVLNQSPSNTGSRVLASSFLQSDPELREIVEDFVARLPERISDLKKAHDALDWSQLKLLAHRLKGAGGSYGYPDLSRLGAAMESSFAACRADGFSTWMRELAELANAARAGLATT